MVPSSGVSWHPLRRPGGWAPSWPAQGLAKPNRTHDWPGSRTDLGLVHPWHQAARCPFGEIVWAGRQGTERWRASLYPKLEEAGQSVLYAKIRVSTGTLGTQGRDPQCRLDDTALHPRSP